nr:dUTPase [uncultured phage]CAI9752239.1 dUTPase [uncultured phage]
MKFTKISEEQFNKDFSKQRMFNLCTYDEIKLPKRATKYSAGYDFYAPCDIVLSPGGVMKMPTGIRVELDSDKMLLCVPRSGLGFKYGLELTNTVGIIDADYSSSSNEGHIWVKLRYPGYYDYDNACSLLTIKKGEAMFQGIILPYYKVDDDNTVEEVRNGGFGSTTKKG